MPQSGFNPRTRVGCDFTCPCLSYQFKVSIHAPVWGATIPQSQPHHWQVFQSTHPCGVRLTKTHTARIVYMFQSTHPCGVRPTMRKQFDRAAAVSIHAPVWGATNDTALDLLSSSFNPRTRVGCDFNHHASRFVLLVSIHAPVWGATNGFALAQSVA